MCIVIAETETIVPTLTLLSTNRSETSATIELNCGTKLNATCTILEDKYDFVIVNGKAIDDKMINVKDSIITISSLEQDIYSIYLAKGAIVDYAGNESLTSNVITLDNTLISVSKIAVNDVTMGLGHIPLRIIFNKGIQFAGESVALAYKFSDDQEYSSITVTGLSGNISSFSVDIPVMSTNNGSLQVIGLYNKNGIFDSSYYSIDEIELDQVFENVIADTIVPELIGFELQYGNNRKYEDEEVYYINATNINDVDLVFTFSEKIANSSVLIIKTSLILLLEILHMCVYIIWIRQQESPFPLENLEVE